MSPPLICWGAYGYAGFANASVIGLVARLSMVNPDEAWRFGNAARQTEVAEFQV